MKKYIVLLLVSAMAATACKSKKNAPTASSASTTTSSSSTAPAASSSSPSSSATASPAASETGAASMTTATGTTTGKVSHKYRAAGCSTVIVFTKDGTEMTLIPKDKLSSEFDVDGLEIAFNYRPLKMPNPAGCTAGMPAEITDLSKK